MDCIFDINDHITLFVGRQLTLDIYVENVKFSVSSQDTIPKITLSVGKF